MRKKKIWLPFILVLMIILTVIFVVLFLSISRTRQYTQYLSLGDRYLQEMQYEDAIIAYQNAIQIDEKRASGYLRVSTVYETTGEYDQAGTVLLDGYETARKKDEIQERMVVIYPLVSIEIQIRIEEAVGKEALNQAADDSVKQPEKQLEESQTQEEVRYEALYEDILAEYKAVAESNFDSTALENAQYVNEGVWNFSGQDKYSVYYRYADLAEDGIPELIISVNEKEAPKQILDIYTIENGTAVRVINSSGAVGYREQYWICTDHRIKQGSFGGANHEEVTYYRVEENNSSLVQDEQFIYDSGSNLMYTHIDRNGNVNAISETEYMEVFEESDVDYEAEWDLLYEGNSIHYIE